MSNDLHLHDIDLGEPLDAAAIAETLSTARDAPVLTAVLQLLRHSAAESGRVTRTCYRLEGKPEVDNPAFHAGAAAALEDAFWEIWKAKTAPEEEGS